jgi:ABC-type branched-subunit amino acid transport system substrate-binding protein
MKISRVLMSVLLLGICGCESPTIVDKVEPEALQQETSTFRSDSVKVGILLPLSGEQSVLGKQLLNAAQLAIFSFPDHKIELLPKDTQGDPILALAATTELLNQRAELILGPLFASEVDGLRAPALASMVPVVSFTNNIDKAGQGVFVFGFSPDIQTQSALEFARKKGYRYFCALLPSTSFGKRLAHTLVEFATKHDLPVPTILYSDPDSKSWEFELEKLKTIKTEVLFVPEGGKHILEVAAYMKESGFGRVRLLGSGQWDDPVVINSPYMEGSWYPASRGQRDWFNKTYESTYQEKPQRLASLAFDMVSLAIVLSQDAKKGSKPFTYQTLIRPQGFRGVEGLFKIESTGKTQRQLSMFQIQSNGVKEIGVVGD